MSAILYERTMAHGSVVRIRRLTSDGEAPVRAVIEVDRRAGTPRSSGSGGHPPPLMAVEGESEPDVVASLLPFAQEDAAIARLLAQRGVR
ncbi:MAG TPA: hypothetical protein VJL28_06025 [Gemmatimonadaceae bacterium]|nr:hypothetical protein [Gemmatimonadaceae bacterium]